MAEITNFEFLGSNKNITKVEVSLDGGLTYGILFSKQNSPSYAYFLEPQNLIGSDRIYYYDPTEENASNGDFPVSISYILYQNGQEIATGTTIICSDIYQSGHIFGVNYFYPNCYIEIDYDGQTIRSDWFGVQVNNYQSGEEIPPIRDGWYISDINCNGMYYGNYSEVEINYSVYNMYGELIENRYETQRINTAAGPNQYYDVYVSYYTGYTDSNGNDYYISGYGQVYIYY